MPYTCNDCATASTGLQSIPIFAGFLRTKRVLRPPASIVIPSLQGVKLLLSEATWQVDKSAKVVYT